MANIAALLAAQLATPERALYRQFTDGAWRDFSAGEIAALAARWQAAFRREGFATGDRVAIGLRNGVNWVALDLAALGAGLVVVPLYVDDNPENQAYCIATSGARLAVVETGRAVEALERVGVAAATLLCARPEGSGARSWEGFLPVPDRPFTAAPMAPDALATICFTSGTAGRPKGVMLSHGNILANVAGCRATDMAQPDDLFLSLLPLSHMFERTGGYYLPLAIGARVVYARGVAQLAEDLADQRPTKMFAVPRVFEKLAVRVRAGVANSPWKRWLLERCAAIGFRVAQGEATIGDRMLAPLLRGVVARLFIGLGLPVLQGYGLTEASPVVAVNRLGDNDPDTVGRPLPNLAVRLSDAGELIVRGPNVMLGYWNDADATTRVLDQGGWLRTGDLAELRDGRVAIRGRLKDILVLSNGEKLPPQDVELAILGDDTFEQVLLLGEGRPFLALLAVAKTGDEKELVRRANERLKEFPRYIRVRRAIASS